MPRRRFSTGERTAPRLWRAACGLLSAALVVASAPANVVLGAPPDEEGPEIADDAEGIALAIDAWRSGRWSDVRDLLEPLTENLDALDDDLLREQTLRYLAEATLLDPLLDPVEADRRARGYVERLLERDRTWSPPSGLHSRAFYDLVNDVRAERESATADACQGKLLSCEADLESLGADYSTSQARYAKLEADYNAQMVQRVQVRVRNRALALLPGGIGHFTGGRPGIGGMFLGLELASGIAGLSLLIVRNTVHGCDRTAAFARGSVVCTPPDTPPEDIPAIQDQVEINRNAELVMGYVFIGLLAVDITVAQVLFERFEYVALDEVPRSELQTDDPSAPAPDADASAPASDADPDAELDADLDSGPSLAVPPTTSTPRSSAKLKLRPSSMLLPGNGGLPGGGGLGFTLEF